MTPVGLAHLTQLALPPPDLVSTAASAGYDFVGIRVRPATAGEHPYPMQPDSPMSRETLMRLDDTGLEVRDVEFLPLGPETGPQDWNPALEAGAALGARTVTVAGADPDPQRLTDTLAALTADAAAVGIRPTLEPISYQPVSTVAGAAAIASAAGAAVLPDALHLQRGGNTVDDVRALDPDLIPCLQLCDGSLDVPQHLDVPAKLPLGMTANGSVRQIESRVRRQRVGAGELPLAELVAAVPAGTPLSVEVPRTAAKEHLTPLDEAQRNLRSVRDLLAEVNARA